MNVKEFLSWTLSGSRRFEVPGILRYGVTVRPNSSERFDEETQPRAACVLVIREDESVLAVSRGRDSDEWGLPGGRVEEGESFEEGAIRELLEETGLTLENPKEVFRRVSSGDHLTATFVGPVSGRVKSSSEGRVAWVSKSVLLDEEHSPFVSYTKELFKFL